MKRNGEYTTSLRVTSIRYPDGRLVHHSYGTSGSDDDNLNRLAAIKDDSSGSPGATLAAYAYLGLDGVVIQDLPEPNIKLDLFGGTSGTYAGLDRFGRQIDQRWYDYGANQDVDRFKYGYDRASNRTWRENTVSKNLPTPVYLDEFYTYDGLHRLKSMDRGELNVTKTGITGTPSREEDWTLDPLGNWSGYVQKASGTTDLDQSRTVNAVNEITDITETTGTSWITPSYDKNGNMSVVPRPDDLANGYTCTYDGWNRMVRVEAGSSVVAAYAYDGVMRRTKKSTFTAGALATIRHFYYTSSWQAIEERIGSSTSSDRQFVCGPLYVDDLILRDRDTDANGTLDERLYALQDANWNVTAIGGTNGDAVERYAYDAYGTPTVLTWAFANRTESDYTWEYLFTGRRWDAATGVFSYRTRTYCPALGQSVSRDLLPARRESLYEYVAGRAPNRVDALGLQGHGLDDVCACDAWLAHFATNRPADVGRLRCIRMLDRCNVHVYCSDNCGALDAITFAQDDFVHICLPRRLASFRLFYALLIHECVHTQQFINNDNRLCQHAPWGGGVPTVPPLRGDACRECTRFERPAYEEQAAYLFPDSPRDRAQWVQAGICVSCGPACGFRPEQCPDFPVVIVILPPLGGTPPAPSPPEVPLPEIDIPFPELELLR